MCRRTLINFLQLRARVNNEKVKFVDSNTGVCVYVYSIQKIANFSHCVNRQCIEFCLDRARILKTDTRHSQYKHNHLSKTHQLSYLPDSFTNLFPNKMHA